MKKSKNIFNKYNDILYLKTNWDEQKSSSKTIDIPW